MFYPSASPIWPDRYIALPAVTTTTKTKKNFVQVTSLPVSGAVQKGGTKTLHKNALPNAHSLCMACPPPTAPPPQPHNSVVPLVTNYHTSLINLSTRCHIATIRHLLASIIMDAPKNIPDNTHEEKPPPAAAAGQPGMPAGTHTNSKTHAENGEKMVSYKGWGSFESVLRRSKLPSLKRRLSTVLTLFSTHGSETCLRC